MTEVCFHWPSDNFEETFKISLTKPLKTSNKIENEVRLDCEMLCRICGKLRFHKNNFKNIVHHEIHEKDNRCELIFSTAHC